MEDYSAGQIAAWIGLAPSAEALEGFMADGRRRFVAVEGEEAVGFLDLKPDGHIHFLYRDPETEPGVASRLLAAAEASLVSFDIDRIFAEASEPARRFFERHGFTVLARRDFEVAGVPIHNYAVEKRIVA